MPKDEHGRYIHYEVVEQTSVPGDSLQYRAKAFLEEKKLNNIHQEEGQLNAEGKILINKTAFVLTHPSGEILYHFSFESKQGRYRFWLTDFLFIPYNRDRYGNFVPSTSYGTPMESNPGKLNAAEWTSYIDAATQQATHFAGEFKRYLSTSQKMRIAPATQQTISTQTW